MRIIKGALILNKYCRMCFYWIDESLQVVDRLNITELLKACVSFILGNIN